MLTAPAWTLRGYMTAAPLKRVSLERYSDKPFSLRGYMTAAPLKLGDDIILSRKGSCSPRLHDRGPIEAIFYYKAEKQLSILSAVT